MFAGFKPSECGMLKLEDIDERVMRDAGNVIHNFMAALNISLAEVSGFGGWRVFSLENRTLQAGIAL